MNQLPNLNSPGTPVLDPEFNSEAARLLGSDPVAEGRLSAPVSKPVPYSVRKGRPPKQKQQVEVVAEQRATIAPTAPPPPTKPAGPLRIVFTGRMRSGKDYAASQLCETVLGFADPLYPLVASVINADADKAAAGVRAMLQILGQWGRGTVNKEYPWTVERALFLKSLPEFLDGYPEGTLKNSVDWTQYGKDEALWFNSLSKRAADLKSVGITNARFKNELDGLKAIGFQHWHVVAPGKEILERLAKEGIKSGDPVLTDYSEQMALSFDRQIMAKMGKTGGKKLRVLWGSQSPAPTEFFSLDELKKELIKY